MPSFWCRNISILFVISGSPAGIEEALQSHYRRDISLHVASPKDQQQNILHWGTGNDSAEMAITQFVWNKHLQNDVFFCRCPIILQCLPSTSATGRTDSASAGASWPNPNSTVVTHAARRSLFQRCGALAVSDGVCPPMVAPPP